MQKVLFPFCFFSSFVSRELKWALHAEKLAPRPVIFIDELNDKAVFLIKFRRLKIKGGNGGKAAALPAAIIKRLLQQLFTKPLIAEIFLDKQRVDEEHAKKYLAFDNARETGVLPGDEIKAEAPPFNTGGLGMGGETFINTVVYIGG